MSSKHERQGKLAIHECGHRVQVIEGELAPHFIVDGLHMDMCPTCFRNLINDWMDEPWRFWSLDEWAGLRIWRSVINDIDPVEEETG